MSVTHFSHVAGVTVPLSLTVTRQLIATTAALRKTKVPWPFDIIAVYASCRAKGGTITAFTVDVKVAGVSVLTVPIDLGAVAAGVTVKGTNAAQTADKPAEAEVTVDLTLTGTGPTTDDLDVVLYLRRKD